MKQAERHSVAKEIFLAACDIPRMEQEAWVRERCGDDVALRLEILDLLQHDVTSSSALTMMPASPDSRPARDRRDEATDHIPGYEILDFIDQGTFGRVYRALQVGTIRREVAIKVLKPEYASAQMLKRFRAEQAALATVNHPNICSVYDSGMTEDGVPYLVMEYIKGRGITEYCAGRSISECLEIFLQVCDAVHHAHQRSMIHRDLKPGNILVAEVDGVPRPTVIDFGLVKSLYQPLVESPVHTRAGQILGTPAYMSPEQISLSNNVGTPSDIYALGTILYELLTGDLPMGKDALEQADKSGFGELQRLIVDHEPERPSMRTAQRLRDARQSGDRSSGLGSVSGTKELRGGLDWIILKCLKKDPSERYGSVSELADDIRRFMKKEPVLAGPPTTTYRVMQFATRHRRAAIVAVTTMFITAIVSSTFAAVLGMRVAEAEWRADCELERAQFEADYRLADEEGKQSLSRDRLETVRGLVCLTASEADAEVIRLRLMLADVQETTGDYGGAVATLRPLDQAIDEGALSSDDQIRVSRRLAVLLSRLGQSDEARDHARRCLELSAHESDRDYSGSLIQWGDTLKRLGDWEVADGHFEEAVEIRRRDDYGGRPNDLAVALDRWGESQLQLGMVEEAERVREESIRHRRNVLKSDPENRAVILQLAASHLIYSDMLLDLGRLDDAEKQLRACRRMVQRHEAEDSGWLQLSAYLSRFDARLYAAQGDYEDARQALNDAGEQVDQLIERSSRRRSDLQRELALIWWQWGDLYLSMGDSNAARRDLRAARAILDSLVLEEASRVDYQIPQAGVVASLSRAYLEQGELERAAVALGDAQALLPSPELGQRLLVLKIERDIDELVTAISEESNR